MFALRADAALPAAARGLMMGLWRPACELGAPACLAVEAWEP